MAGREKRLRDFPVSLFRTAPAATRPVASKAWNDLATKIFIAYQVSWCYMSGTRPANPAHSPEMVARLARERKVEFLWGVLQDILGFGLDREDICEWFEGFEAHIARHDCFFRKAEATRRYPPGTISDYYQARVDMCRGMIFVKFTIYRGKLVVTSFKDLDNG